MKITGIKEVTLRRFERESDCLAKYDITFDDQLMVHNVIVKRLNGKLIIQFPAYRTADGYRNYCRPITKSFGEHVKGKILGYFEEHKHDESN